MSPLETALEGCPELKRLYDQGRLTGRGDALYPVPPAQEITKGQPLTIDPETPVVILSGQGEWIIPGTEIPYRSRGQRDEAYFERLRAGEKTATSFMCYNNNDIGHAWVAVHDAAHGQAAVRAAHYYPKPPYGMRHAVKGILGLSVAGAVAGGAKMAVDHFYRNQRVKLWEPLVAAGVGMASGSTVFAFVPVGAQIYDEALANNRWLSGAVGLSMTDAQLRLMHCDRVLKCVGGRMWYNVLNRATFRSAANCMSEGLQENRDVGVRHDLLVAQAGRPHGALGTIDERMKYMGPPMFARVTRHATRSLSPVHQTQVGGESGTAMEFFHLPFGDEQALVMQVAQSSRLKACPSRHHLADVLLHLQQEGIELQGAVLRRAEQPLEPIIREQEEHRASGWKSAVRRGAVLVSAAFGI